MLFYFYFKSIEISDKLKLVWETNYSFWPLRVNAH